jgi:hypothetical protein
MPEVGHQKRGSANYTLHSDPITVRKCPICGREEAGYGGGLLYCPDHPATQMKSHDKIMSKKVDEVKNRVVTDRTPTKPSPMKDAWDLGLIKGNVKATVYPLYGGTPLKMEGKLTRAMWADKVVRINGDYFRLTDIGKALGGMV